MSFIISSYLKRPDVVIRDINDPNLKSYFISTDDFNALTRYKDKFDTFYIDGYICINYNEQEILSERQWDLVDQLWAYLLNMVEELLDQKYAESSFPDQPLKISFIDQRDHILFELYGGKKKWLLPKKQFFNELLDAAEKFFIQIGQIFLQTDYTPELAQINKLRQRLQQQT